VSDLGHETTQTSTAGSGTDETGSGHDTLTYQRHDAAGPGPGPGRGYESPAEADRYGDYQETETETEARIAGEDELPTPQQSRAATWGDNPDYYDDTDLASEYDGDASALTTTDHNPHDGQETAPGTRDHPASDQHAQIGTDAEDTAQEPPDTTAEGQTRNANPDLPGQDTAHSGDEPQSPEEAGPSPAGSQQAADAGTSTDDPGHAATDAQQDQPDSAGSHRPDTRPETDDRIKALLVELDQTRAERDQATAERDQATAERDQVNAELDQTKGMLSETQAELDHTKAELDQANQEIADLHTRNQDQPAPSEDSEQPPTDSSERAAEAVEPEHSAEEADGPPDQGASLNNRENTDQGVASGDTGLSVRTRLRHAVSSDHVAVAATLVDAYDTASKFAAHAMLDGLTPLAATAAGVTALVLARAERHRKEKDA
jgi:hypothetical protein